ncbi:MAG: hypothetical protein ACLTYN_18310 [Dysosmobacter welbionis]
MPGWAPFALHRLVGISPTYCAWPGRASCFAPRAFIPDVARSAGGRQQFCPLLPEQFLYLKYRRKAGKIS